MEYPVTVSAVSGGCDLASDCCFHGSVGLTAHPGNLNGSMISARSRVQDEVRRQDPGDVCRAIGAGLVQVFLASSGWYPRGRCYKAGTGTLVTLHYPVVVFITEPVRMTRFDEVLCTWTD